MSLSIGIVGLPNVGVVAVPDARLARLAALYDDAPVVPATVTFVDIAGLVRGASQGEGTHHLADGVGLAYGRQELVAQAFPL